VKVKFLINPHSGASDMVIEELQILMKHCNKHEELIKARQFIVSNVWQLFGSI
jgi:hypothetical protein